MTARDQFRLGTGAGFSADRLDVEKPNEPDVLIIALSIAHVAPNEPEPGRTPQRRAAR